MMVAVGVGYCLRSVRSINMTEIIELVKWLVSAWIVYMALVILVFIYIFCKTWKIGRL